MYSGERRYTVLRAAIAFSFGFCLLGIKQSEADPIYQVTLRAIRADNGDANRPLAGVHVLVRESGHARTWEATTDVNGYATVSIDVILSNNFGAYLHLDGFEDGIAGFHLKERQLGERNNQVKTLQLPNVVLKKAPGVQVHVHVQSSDQERIEGAVVGFNTRSGGLSAGDIGSTDDGGNVTLFLNEGGTFDVKITHSNFESLTDVKEFNRYGEEQSFNYVLKRKAKPPSIGDLYFEITVTGRNARNQAAPIAGALVRTPKGTQAVTDANGYARLALNEQYGEEATVTASAEGYKSQTQRKVLEVRNSIGASTNQGPLEFHLEPGDEPTGNRITLVVTVQDTDTGRPVSGADVALRQIDNPKIFNHRATNAEGESSFTLASSPNAAENRAGLRAVVTSPDYDEKWSDIMSDLLLPSLQPRIFMVYVKHKQIDWQGTYTDGQSVCTVSGPASNFTYQCEWNPKGLPAGAQYDKHKSTCAAIGNSASCTFSDGFYHDGEKNQKYKGVETLTIKGNQITSHMTIKGPVEWVKITKDFYQSAHHDGAEFSGTVTRKSTSQR